MPASCLRRLVYTTENDGQRKTQIRMASPSEMMKVMRDEERRKLDEASDDNRGDSDERVTLSSDAMRRRNSRVVVTGIGREMPVSTLYSLLSTADVHVDGMYRCDEPATTMTTTMEDAEREGNNNNATSVVIVEYVHPWQATQALIWFDNLDVGRGNMINIRRWTEKDGVVRLENHLPRECRHAVAAAISPSRQIGNASHAIAGKGDADSNYRRGSTTKMKKQTYRGGMRGSWPNCLPLGSNNWNGNGSSQREKARGR